MADRDQGAAIEPEVVTLTSWAEVIDHLGRFPAPRVGFGQDGDLEETAWIFRGVEDSLLELEPTVERRAKSTRMTWAALEAKVAEEFKYRAPVYVDRPLVAEDDLTWLAFMRHHAVPTRLLDFTLSPFVALYFAARDWHREKRPKCARIWAMDSQAIAGRSRAVVTRARQAEWERRGERHGGRVSSRSDDAASDRDVLKSEALAMRRRTEEVLAATGTFRAELNRQGCVCVALPPSFNPRLASQQGLFLLNGAEDLPFATSLARMMTGRADWCRAFDIQVGLLSEIERRLFQMNIHEQSLFPDMHGLAGLINQRIRLHWS
jgi:hypothetical protein